MIFGGVAVVGMPQPANPSEDARLGLVQAPATLTFQPMIMAAGGPQVGSDGGAADSVVASVISIAAAGAGPAADHDAASVADFQVAAQHRAGCPPSWIIPALAGKIVGELADQVSDHRCPAAQRVRFGFQRVQRGDGDLQLHEGPAAGGASSSSGRAGTGDPAADRIPVLIGDHKPPLHGPQGGGQVTGQLRVHRSPPGDLRWILVVAQQRGQLYPQLHSAITAITRARS